MQYLIDNLDSHDPAINLALEEYAVRHLDMSHDYCFLYVNQPCIVLGRHQNAFEEINYPHVLHNNIPVYRRISGGGTVYHDSGNLSFSFITRYDKKKFNNYAYFNQPIIDALHSLKIPAELNGRNDIVIGEKKISGNAQFTSLNRMVSHGTLLFDSKLDNLSEALRPPPYQISSRAIKSVRSPVTNISDYLEKPVAMNQFKDLILEFILGRDNPVPLYSFSELEWNEIQVLAETKYRSWDWNFGESPPFVLERQAVIGSETVKVLLEVEKGRIVSCDLKGFQITEDQISELNTFLSGVRFGPEDLKACLEKFDFSYWNGNIDRSMIVNMLLDS